MTARKTPSDSILQRQAIGFLVLIGLCWIVEILQIPSRFFHEPAGFLWTRVLFRTVILLAIWAWTHLTSKRLLKRLHHLEDFLLMCSWCRRIGHQGRWLTTEEYFGSQFETETSHGICPDCALKHSADFAAERDPGDET